MKQSGSSGKCCLPQAEGIRALSFGKMCRVRCRRMAERILKLFSTSFCTSEILPEVEQISLFTSMENGQRLCPTELLPIELSTLNIGESPTVAEEYMLSAILVEKPPRWSLLSVAALNGILDRASRRGGRPLPALLLTAIHGMIAWWKQESSEGGRTSLHPENPARL